MTISSGMCHSFKAELLRAIHDFSADTIKIALYLASASLGPETTAYTTSGEATGTNWSAGGQAFATRSGYPQLDPTGKFAVWSFEDDTVENVTVTFRAILLYNASKANRAIMVLDRGVDVVITAGPLQLLTNPAQPHLPLIR